MTYVYYNFVHDFVWDIFVHKAAHFILWDPSYSCEYKRYNSDFIKDSILLGEL